LIAAPLRPSAVSRNPALKRSISGSENRGTRTSDYDFALPADRIAQQPLARRDESRLLVLHRDGGAIEHRRFRDLPELIAPGDALVLNTTKVFRARLLGRRASGADAEILLLRELGDGTWEAMVSPGGKLRPGRTVNIAEGFDVEILEITDRRTRVVRLRTAGPVMEAIERHGHVPLPPYIARPDVPADADRYQTVYATCPGSVAAPTAGLHFTPELLAKLAADGVRRADVVLHVGAGTFKPVEVDDPANHVMHEERFSLPAETAASLNDVRRAGGAIWAVGTTCARTLESAVRDDGTFTEREGETRLFIRPPYRFRAVDKLVTNFHLPRSTLVMLVAAFAGYELTMRAYREAVDEGYRFYSYGDAMVVV
jgi:S-adenosylmethionine:tRNA ribosyltransferase-isomerase